MQSTAEVVAGLRRYQLLETQQLDELGRQLLEQSLDPRALARQLIDRCWLTPFQANLLLQNRGQELLLGSYVLLEKLGEGGMGIVYKARNWKLGRVVALKLIRKERLHNTEVLKRFHREVRIAAQLSHANVVHAFDADQAGGSTFLVMEYVEGIDLGRIVKQRGPLPVAQACEYVRQAALGLQHAFERGLVHRDIKPTNLLLQSTGPVPVVKILDMGLARFGVGERDGNESVSTLTIEGAFMGTPDYVAPEQSLNSHDVDIRADLYSLGCTFYYLVTGSPPFPGGALAEKLLKHQLVLPKPVESLRPEVSAEVAAVVARLLAKEPGHRYQTPAELARALEQAAAKALSSEQAETEMAAPSSPSPDGDAPTDVAAGHEWAHLTPTSMVIAPPPRTRARRHWPVLVGLIVLAGGVWWVTRPGDNEKPPEKEVVKKPSDSSKPKPADDGKRPSDDPSRITASGPVTEQWLKDVRGLPADKQAEAVKAKLQALNPGCDLNKFTVHIEGVEVVALNFSGWNVNDLSPLKALTKLRGLICPTAPGAIVTIVDLSPLRGLPLSNLDLSEHCISDLTPLKDMKDLSWISLTGTRVESLVPLTGMKQLERLHLERTLVRDLAPLKDMPLRVLNLSYTAVDALPPLKLEQLQQVYLRGTQVRDLLPLRGAPLENLSIAFTPVADLGPLTGSMTLRSLDCQYTPVRSLAPLVGAKINELRCHGTAITDYSPLEKIELAELQCDFVRERDLSILAGLKLKRINFEDAARFFERQKRDPKQLNEFITRVGKLPPNEQIDVVTAWLKDFNPGSDKLTANPQLDLAEGAVIGLELANATGLYDLSPLRALQRLEKLDIINSSPSEARLADLTPLRGLPLREFGCRNSRVFDLGPLANMKLTALNIKNCLGVEDLTPLRGMPLHRLDASGTNLRDLSPLAGMKIEQFSGCQAWQDLSPLRDLPLGKLALIYDPGRHGPLLRSMPKLAEVNGLPIEKFWQQVTDARLELVRRELKRMSPSFSGTVTPLTVDRGQVLGLSIQEREDFDISPLRNLPELQLVQIRPTSGSAPKFTTLAPLSGMTLTHLDVGRCSQLTDLRPLREMTSLRSVRVDHTGVADLAPLKGRKLTEVVLYQTPVKDLSPLKGMQLTTFSGSASILDYSPLHDMPLQQLELPFNWYRDADWVRKLRSLERINGQKVDAFWQKVDAERKVFDERVAQIRRRPPRKQVEEALKWLAELNPGFEPAVVVEPVIRDSHVISLTVDGRNLVNLSPLSAVDQLEILSVTGTSVTPSKVADLWPLKDVKLRRLTLNHTAVTDLRPLRGMPLVYLSLTSAASADLTTLGQVPLTNLHCHPLSARDVAALKEIETLRRINGRPAEEAYQKAGTEPQP